MKTLNVDAVVIGAGTAGANAFHILKAAGAKVLLVDRGPLGTTCARVGCMPSKAALHAAARWSIGRALAIDTAHLAHTPDDMWREARDMRDTLAKGAAQRTIKAAAENLLMGEARFLSPNTLLVDGAQIQARAFVVCTGSRPVIPAALLSLGDRLITTDSLFDLEALPSRIGLLGMGAIGLEMGVALARLGVTVVGADQREAVGGAEDPCVQARAQAHFGALFPIWLGGVVQADADGDKVRLVQGRRQATVDRLLVAAGRQPNFEALDLPAAGIDLDEHNRPRIAPRTLQAGPENILFAGDVYAERPLMHEAADEGAAAGKAALALLGKGPAAMLKRRTAMSIVFTDPDLCAVGLSYRQAVERRAIVGEAEGSSNGRSRILAAQDNLVRIYADPSSGKILGASLFATHGEHLAHQLAWAVHAGQTINDLLAAPFYHPSVEEMLQSALKDAHRQLPEETC